MKKLINTIKKFPLKLVPIAVCATILAAVLSIYITIHEEQRVTELNEEMVEKRSDVEWQVLEEVITSSYENSIKSAENTALEIEYSIRYNYPDLKVLEEQFIRDEYSTKFNELLKAIIEEDLSRPDSVLTIVGTEKNIITMFANNKSHFLSRLDSDKALTWDEVSESSLNPVMTYEAFQSIVKKKNELNITVSSSSKSGHIENISSSGLSTLKEIYMTEGIEGLEHITLLAPAYITDSGDIFGSDDNTFLKKNANHKLIIVNAIDVADIISEHKHEVSEIIGTVDNLQDTANSQGDRILIQTLLSSFILFLLSMFMIAIYNSEEKKGHLDGGDEGK